MANTSYKIVANNGNQSPAKLESVELPPFAKAIGNQLPCHYLIDLLTNLGIVIITC